MRRYFLASASIEGFRGINNDGDPLVLKFKHDAVNSVHAPKETPNKPATGSRLVIESLFNPVFGDRLNQKPGF